MGKLLLLLLLMMMMFLYPGLAQKGLDCENDMLKSITCTWDGMRQGTNLSVNPQSKCSIVCRSPYRTSTCDLGQDRRCTLQILTSGFSFSQFAPSYNLNVVCEDHKDPVAKMEKYIPRFKRVRLPPLERPTIDNSTVSWTFVLPPFSVLHAEYFLFELQQKARGQEWKVVLLNKGSTSCLLDEEELVRGEQYWFRVRVKPNITDIPKAEWSEWSAEATWISTVGRPPATPAVPQPGLPEEQVESWLIWWATVGALAVLLFLVGIMFLGTRILKASLIPTPSKYFDGLDSVYKGNFKAWLGSILTLDALGVEVLTEYTSPVEVVKKEHGKSCKSFSNKQYFQEEPQKTALLPPPPPQPFFEEESLEPCTEFSPYDDMGKDCAGLGVQCVDSGVDQDSCQSDSTDSSIAGTTIIMDMTTTTSGSSSSGTSSGNSSMSGSISTSTPTSSEKDGSISWSSISWSSSTVANVGIGCNASGGSSTSGGNVSISSSSTSTGGGSSSCTPNSSISYSSSSSGVSSASGVSSSSGFSSASGGNVSRLHVELDYKSFTRLLHAGPQSPDSGVSMASGEEDSREEEEGSHDERSSPGHHHHPGTFSFRSTKGPWRTDLPQPLVHPCTVPFSGTCGDPVGPNLCSTPTGWSPHKQNPLDMYGQLQPCSDDYQPLQAS